MAASLPPLGELGWQHASPDQQYDSPRIAVRPPTPCWVCREGLTVRPGPACRRRCASGWTRRQGSSGWRSSTRSRRAGPPAPLPSSTATECAPLPLELSPGRRTVAPEPAVLLADTAPAVRGGGQGPRRGAAGHDPPRLRPRHPRDGGPRPNPRLQPRLAPVPTILPSPLRLGDQLVSVGAGTRSGTR